MAKGKETPATSEEAYSTTEATTAATVRRGLGRRGHLFIGRTTLNR